MIESIYFKIAYIAASYLLGSIVFGYIMARIYGGKGSGRKDLPGSAGAGRQFGIKAGLPTFIFDVGKGVAVALVGLTIGLDIIIIAIACIAVIVGHNWPVFFKFRGGGGLAAMMGIAGVLIPVPFWISFWSVVIIGFIYKYTLGKKYNIKPHIFAAAIGLFLLPLLTWVFGFPPVLIILFSVIFIIIAAKGLFMHFMSKKVRAAK